MSEHTISELDDTILQLHGEINRLDERMRRVENFAADTRSILNEAKTDFTGRINDEVMANARVETAVYGLIEYLKRQDFQAPDGDEFMEEFRRLMQATQQSI